MKIVPAHIGLLREYNEVRYVKNLTECFAHSICTVNKSQSLSTGCDFVPPRGLVAMPRDTVGCYNWEGDATGTYWVESSDAVDYLAVHRITKIYLAQNVNSAKIEKL